MQCSVDRCVGGFTLNRCGRAHAPDPVSHAAGRRTGQRLCIRASFLDLVLPGMSRTPPSIPKAPVPLSQSSWDYACAVTVQQLVPAVLQKVVLPDPPAPSPASAAAVLAEMEAVSMAVTLTFLDSVGLELSEPVRGPEMDSTPCGQQQQQHSTLDVEQLKLDLERQWQRQTQFLEGGEGGAAVLLLPLPLSLPLGFLHPDATATLLRQAAVPHATEQEEEPGYRTADQVSVVCVPSTTLNGRWKVMVQKSSIYNSEEDGMDSFKYAASLNEWETWSRHHQHLQGCSHLVQLLGFRKRRDTIQIFSEYCQGGDLQELLRGRHTGLDEAHVRHIALDILTGLGTLHSNGLVYGDLKPSNVFIGGSEQQPEYKIGDFGTLREAGRKHLHYFVSGFGFTPEYASPETLEHGASRATATTDMWSFGVLLHELATGRLPEVVMEFKRLHDGGFEDALQQRRRYLRSHPADDSSPTMDQGISLYSPDLHQVIQACLQERPERRPQSTDEVRLFRWFGVSASSVLTTAGAAEYGGGVSVDRAVEHGDSGYMTRNDWGGCDWEPLPESKRCWGEYV